MNTSIIARVLLMPDGGIHIAYMNKQTYFCIANVLFNLLSDPFNFVEKSGNELSASTGLLNKKQEGVENIPGLTLLTVSSDNKIVCEFPELFQILFLAAVNPVKNNENMSFSQDWLQSLVINEKNAYLLLYMEQSRSGILRGLKRKSNVHVCAETQAKIFEEILKSSIQLAPSSFATSVAEASVVREYSGDIGCEETNTSSKQKIKKMVSVPEYALIHGMNAGSVHTWIKREKLKSAIKGENGKWLIDPDEIPSDGRAGRKVEARTDGSNRKNVHLKSTSYEDIQIYIKERNLVTDNIRPFVRTREEIKYYETRNYHEVAWESGNAMIIDINPDYYCKQCGKTNRELISSGESPVVPDADAYRFHLHHIGQQKNSPLAIIPEYDHNSKELYSCFHQGKSDNEDLHDRNFESKKRLFWNEYLEKYDQNGGYRGIKYLNPKSKRRAK